VQQVTTQTLANIRTGLDQQVQKLGQQITAGMKNGFTVSITKMMLTSIGIIALGFLLILQIPLVPLRSRTKAKPEDQELPISQPMH